MAALRIVIVADADTDRVRLERICSDAGYEVIRTASGAEALDALSEDRADLVLLDVVTDEMDGFKICRELSTNTDTGEVPVIMVSDKEQKVDKLWAAQQGAKGHISKPYTAEQVLEQIRRFL